MTRCRWIRIPPQSPAAGPPSACRTVSHSQQHVYPAGVFGNRSGGPSPAGLDRLALSAEQRGPVSLPGEADRDSAGPRDPGACQSPFDVSMPSEVCQRQQVRALAVDRRRWSARAVNSRVLSVEVWAPVRTFLVPSGSDYFHRRLLPTEQVERYLHRSVVVVVVWGDNPQGVLCKLHVETSPSCQHAVWEPTSSWWSCKQL